MSAAANLFWFKHEVGYLSNFVLFNVGHAESLVLIVHQHYGPSSDAHLMSFRLVTGII